jgi:Flagellar protein YcgR
VIGLLPKQALFITPPMASGKPARFVPGERIELLGVSGQSIYEFGC